MNTVTNDNNSNNNNNNNNKGTYAAGKTTFLKSTMKFWHIQRLQHWEKYVVMKKNNTKNGKINNQVKASFSEEREPTITFCWLLNSHPSRGETLSNTITVKQKNKTRWFQSLKYSHTHTPKKKNQLLSLKQISSPWLVDTVSVYEHKRQSQYFLLPNLECRGQKRELLQFQTSCLWNLHDHLAKKIDQIHTK